MVCRISYTSFVIKLMLPWLAMELWVLPLSDAMGSSAYSICTACQHANYKRHSQKGGWQTELHKDLSNKSTCPQVQERDTEYIHTCTAHFATSNKPDCDPKGTQVVASGDQLQGGLTTG